MKRKWMIFLVAYIFAAIPDTSSQIRLSGYDQDKIASDLFCETWSARWVSVPDEPDNVFGVYHFRKVLELTTVPTDFIIHVSADNRYKLFINGMLVSLGPARCDTFNWNFETVDIAPYLRVGKNVLAAVVWNLADRKPTAQMSFGQTGFILQGNGTAERIADTDGSWRCMKNTSYSPWDSPVYGYYVCGPGEMVDTGTYPWGWELEEYDDSQWVSAATGLQGVMKGGVDYPGRLLVPRPIPPMEFRAERLAASRLVEKIDIPDCFPAICKSFMITPNTKARLILDNGVLTTGYPIVKWSMGKGTRITIGYTEAFYEKVHRMDKGNRNETEGKIFAGYEDVVLADGGSSRSYSPLWWRTWRYLDIRIETGSEPLVIEDICAAFSAYPFRRESAFDAPERPELTRILDIGWRTARLCANETYMDCPYYEQLQYFGDTRIQAMITLYNTTDTHMVRNAIEQGRQSITPDGFTMSRWPSDSPQFIPTFSLWWICMGHDYWMMRGDEEYMRTLLPAYRSILAWFAQWLKPDGSLDRIPYWFFGDWAKGFERGVPPREDDGGSAFQDLVFLLALDATAQMERNFGESAVAEIYDRIAGNIRYGFDERYWNAERGLYADTYRQDSFSQHVNSMAVLAGVVAGNKARDIMLRSLESEDMTETTIYFRYYFNMALKKAGMGDLLLDNLGIWEEQMSIGLTTWAEEPEPSRSDCHAWGSSPNVEFFRTVLGIEPASPRFQTVCISPSLGSLGEVAGEMPHPAGKISVSYRRNDKGVLVAELSLPDTVSGEMMWKGKSYPLEGGRQIIKTE